jgi:hypothetical protein
LRSRVALSCSSLATRHCSSPGRTASFTINHQNWKPETITITLASPHSDSCMRTTAGGGIEVRTDTMRWTARSVCRCRRARCRRGLPTGGPHAQTAILRRARPRGAPLALSIHAAPVLGRPYRRGFGGCKPSHRGLHYQYTVRDI